MTMGPFSMTYCLAKAVAFLTDSASMPSTQMPARPSTTLNPKTLHHVLLGKGGRVLHRQRVHAVHPDACAPAQP